MTILYIDDPNIGDPDWIRHVRSESVVELAVEQFHADHDQSSHGNWATGGGKTANVTTVDQVEPIVDAMFESLQARYQAMEDTAIGPVASAKWRASRGMKLTDAEQYTIDLMNAEPDAVAEYKQAMRDRVAEYTTADADTVAAVTAGAAYEADNPRFAGMIAQHGEIPILPVSDADGADARYIQNAIIIGETTSHVESAEITRDAFTVDRSMSGTIRHEYGHHVQTRLTKDQDERWSEAINQWGSMSAGPDDLERMYANSEGGAGLSLYARMNSDETFAEAFSLVTHRDFDPGADYGPAQPIVDFMREIVE